MSPTKQKKALAGNSALGLKSKEVACTSLNSSGGAGRVKPQWRSITPASKRPPRENAKTRIFFFCLKGKGGAAVVLP